MRAFTWLLIFALFFTGTAHAGASAAIQPLLAGFESHQRSVIEKAYDDAHSDADRDRFRALLTELAPRTRFHARDLLPGGRTAIDRYDVERIAMYSTFTAMFSLLAGSIAAEAGVLALGTLAIAALPVVLVAAAVYVAAKHDRFRKDAQRAQSLVLSNLPPDRPGAVRPCGCEGYDGPSLLGVSESR